MMIIGAILRAGKYVPTQQNYNKCDTVNTWKICTYPAKY